MASKYDYLHEAIKAAVREAEGIGQRLLVHRMQGQYGDLTYETVATAVGELAMRKELFRIRTHANASELGFYTVWTKLPENVDPKDLVTISRLHATKSYQPRDDSPLCHNCGHPWGEHSKGKSACPKVEKPATIQYKAKPEPFVPMSMRVSSQPSPIATLAPASVPHPPRKPGTMSINLETPIGPIPFTLEEARRMYEQLYGLFGANGL